MATNNNNQQPKSKVANQKQSQDQNLVELTKHFILFKDDNNVTYIQIILYGKGFQEIGKNIVRIRSGDFKEYINDLYYRNYFRYPQKNVLESLISHLIYKAKQDGTRIEIFNRLGIDQDENIYIDLANGTDDIVKVTMDGWQVGKYPVLFTRYDHTASLPDPKEGGNLKDLLQFIPVKNKHEECLLLCWLVASMIPDIDRCFLLLEGPPGSRKSTIANRLKSLIDPMKGDALILTSKEAEVAQQLGQHCIPFFDNINSMSKDISNMFCTCFGESVYSKKALYTDDGSIIFNLNGNMIFTSIKLERPRPDFLERTFKITTIKQSGFMSSRKLKKQFGQIAPQLFGALLDTLVKVLNVVGQIPEPDKYRTVDFDQYCAATAEVLGYGQETFWEARDHTETIKTKGMIKAFPVIQALVSFLQSCKGYWRGCMNELLYSLNSFSNDPERLPKAANSLSQAINTTLKAEIDAAGIAVTPQYSDQCQLYEITFHDPMINNQNKNVVLPPLQNTSTVVVAVDQTISEQINDIAELEVNVTKSADTINNQATKPVAPRGTLSDGIGKVSQGQEQSLSPDNTEPPVRREKSKNHKPSVLDHAVSDLFENLGQVREVESDQNPFLVDDIFDGDDGLNHDQ